jgi:hypothetical protein
MTTMRNLITLFAAMLFITGCATVEAPTPFYVEVSSLAAPGAASHRTYVLLSANPEVESGDLQFQEFARYIEYVLQERGFVAAADESKADVAIMLGYGIGDPKTERYSYAVPTFGQTGISSASTIGNTTYFQPSFGVTGYVPVNRTATTYKRHIWIGGYDLGHYRETEEAVQIWSTTITSTGWSGDLRRVFPVMVAAAKAYVATNTQQQREVSLLEDSPEVIQVKASAQVR